MQVRSGCGRAGPLGLRRPGSDERAHGPFSPARRSKRPRPPSARSDAQPPRNEGVSTPLQSRNLTQNQTNIFHLNCVPRHADSSKVSLMIP